MRGVSTFQAICYGFIDSHLENVLEILRLGVLSGKQAGQVNVQKPAPSLQLLFILAFIQVRKLTQGYVLDRTGTCVASQSAFGAAFPEESSRA